MLTPPPPVPHHQAPGLVRVAQAAPRVDPNTPDCATIGPGPAYRPTFFHCTSRIQESQLLGYRGWDQTFTDRATGRQVARVFRYVYGDGPPGTYRAWWNPGARPSWTLARPTPNDSGPNTRAWPRPLPRELGNCAWDVYHRSTEPVFAVFDCRE